MLPWLQRLAVRLPGRGPAAVVPPGPLLLDACLLLGRRPGGAEPLEPRLERLVGQLSAELSGCRWCIDAGRHYARKAGVPAEALGAVHAAAEARCFSDRERAALGLATAVAQGAVTDGLAGGPALAAARRHFSEREIVRLTVLAAGEHFGDCLAGRSGAAPLPSHPLAVRGLS